MSLRKVFTTHCDICWWWEPESKAGKGAVSRRKARAIGWRTYNFMGERFDVCPTCQDNGYDPWNRPKE